MKPNNSVTNCQSKQAAINACADFKAHFPFRHCAVVDTSGKWGWVNGKTMARINNAARHGANVYLITNN